SEIAEARRKRLGEYANPKKTNHKQKKPKSPEDMDTAELRADVYKEVYGT
ncbi:unnamed protein product, partial [marine sediment metagenome]